MRQNAIKKTMVILLAVLLTVAMLPAALLAASSPALPDEGTLIIHKYKVDDTTDMGSAGNGLEATGITAPTVEGIQFTAYLVSPYDGVIEYPTGTTPPKGLYPETAAEAIAAGLVATSSSAQGLTGTDGTLTFADLARGVYMIRETSSTDKDGVTYAPIEDFLVSIPMANPSYEAGSSDPAKSSPWLSTIHVYPKNQSMTPSKVTGSGQYDPKDPQGDTDITYTITAPIPGDLTRLTNLQIVDTFDPLLKMKDNDTSSVKVYTVDSRTAAAGAGTLLATPAGYSVALSANKLTVDFVINDALKTAYAAGEKYVRVVFTASLTDSALGMLLENDANIRFSNDSGTTWDEQNIPKENRPITYTGTIGVEKFDKDSDPIAGVKFKVASSIANAEAGTFLKDVTGNDIVGTTNADGYAELRGIPYNIPEGTDPGKAPEIVGTQTFYLVEVEVPTGYNLLADPILVPGAHAFKYFDDSDDEIFLKDYADEDDFYADVKYVINYFNAGIEVYNTTSFTLPRTGAAGIVLYTLGGVLLLSLVIVLVARRRRKNEA